MQPRQCSCQKSTGFPPLVHQPDHTPSPHPRRSLPLAYLGPMDAARQTCNSKPSAGSSLLGQTTGSRSATSAPVAPLDLTRFLLCLSRRRAGLGHKDPEAVTQNKVLVSEHSWLSLFGSPLPTSRGHVDTAGRSSQAMPSPGALPGFGCHGHFLGCVFQLANYAPMVTA